MEVRTNPSDLKSGGRGAGERVVEVVGEEKGRQFKGT